MRRFRRLGPIEKGVYLAMLGVFALLAIVALFSGWWPYAVASLLLGTAFAYSAPFVLGRGWRPRPAKPTRRPVVRRRR